MLILLIYNKIIIKMLLIYSKSFTKIICIIDYIKLNCNKKIVLLSNYYNKSTLSKRVFFIHIYN